MALPTSQGVAYLESIDAIDAPTPRPPGRGAQIIRIALFLLIFFGLQWAWSQARDTAAERLVIHQATVGVGVALVNLIAPEVRAWGEGSKVRADGGGINVLNGCEGTEVFFLLLAAFLVAPIPWKKRVAGILAGVVFVFAVNQLRLVALFFAFRSDRELFYLLHETALPVALVVLTALFFSLWLRPVAGSAA